MRICKRMARGLAYALALLMVTNFGLFLGSGAGIAEEGTKSGAETQGQTAAFSAELLDEVPEGLLCIGVLPTQTGGVMKYYVPDEQTRDELYSRISKMDVEKLDSMDIPPQWVLDAGELNITVKYGKYSLYLFEGGVMRIDRWQDYDLTEWVVKDEAVAAYIMDIVRKEIGLTVFDNGSIQNIVKAELMTGPLYTGQPKESLVITDAEKLAKIETLLSGAGKSFWSKCPFGNCKLVLTTGAGEEIALAVACDSCTVFYADGCFFDYMPEEYRNSDEHPDNSILFELFGVTPEYFLAG